MLIDPWGEILAERDEGEGVVIGAIDPSRLAEVRENLPALTHRVLYSTDPSPPRPSP